MALPENVLATVTYNAPFLSPRDRARSALRCWERGGLALNNATGGLNVYDWQFRADADTGEVYAGVPTAEGADTFTVAETLVYTIDPPPREIAGSFDTNMQPIIAWRNDDGAFFRWFDPVANDFVVESLGSRVHSVHLAIDDVRDIAVLSGVTDTILAYVNRTTLYYRQLRDRFATEYELGGGWRQLYQIGMNNLLRFQFARSPEQPDRDPNLNYLLPASRAGKIAGFDSQGDAAFYEFVEPGIVGDQAPPLSRTKLVASNGQTYFLRNDGGAWQNQSVDITIEFYLDGVELRASRTYTFTADDQGRITRANTAADGDVAVDIVESGIGTRTYTGTFTPAEGGDGVTFNLVSVFGLPTTGEFTPNWNASGDYYGGGVVPTGAIHYTDYGTFVTLRTVADGVFTARSATTRMRWPAGTLPEALRPASTRSYYCTVVNAGVTVAGAVQFEPNGAAEFWPLEVDGTRLVRGEFLRSITTVRQKGLPAEWQLTYAKAGPSLFAPIPVLDSITPDTVDRFDTGLTITLAGSGFRDNSEARLDGVPLNTTFNSNTELEADVPDEALETATLYDVTVFTPTPGGGQTAAQVLTVENPVPVLTSIDPADIEDVEVTDDVEITLTGTDFVPESVVELDGTPVSTTYVSSTELTALLPQNVVEDQGEYAVTVVNPAPGGGESAAQTFETTGEVLDEFWANTVALLQIENDVIVERTGLVNLVTHTGASGLSSLTAKFGTQSLRNQGTSAQNTNYTTLIDSTGQSLFLFPGQFTIELWANTTNNSDSYMSIFAGGGTSTTTNGQFWLEINGSNIYFSWFTTGYNNGGKWNGWTHGVWRHIAVTRDASNVLRLFIDGVQRASTTTSQSFGVNLGGGNSAFNIGRTWNSDNGDLNGYIEELRITKGVARYTEEFTPPTEPFPVG